MLGVRIVGWPKAPQSSQAMSSAMMSTRFGRFGESTAEAAPTANRLHARPSHPQKRPRWCRMRPNPSDPRNRTDGRSRPEPMPLLPPGQSSFLIEPAPSCRCRSPASSGWSRSTASPSRPTRRFLEPRPKAPDPRVASFFLDARPLRDDPTGPRVGSFFPKGAGSRCSTKRARAIDTNPGSLKTSDRNSQRWVRFVTRRTAGHRAFRKRLQPRGTARLAIEFVWSGRRLRACLASSMCAIRPSIPSEAISRQGHAPRTERVPV